MIGSEVVGTVKTEKRKSDWAPVSLPKALLLRVDAVYEALGNRSRAEYIRCAILKQLSEDEEKAKQGGNGNGVESRS